MWKNLTTGEHSEDKPGFSQFHQASNPSREMLAADDWYECVPRPAPSEGYEHGPEVWVVLDGMLVCENNDTLIQDRLDQEARTAEQERQDAIDAKLARLTPALLQKAMLFRATLRIHFGPGAEVNHSVSAEAVAGYFEQRRMNRTIAAVESADAVALMRYFADLTEWTGDGTTWSFPWEMLPE